MMHQLDADDGSGARGWKACMYDTYVDNALYTETSIRSRASCSTTTQDGESMRSTCKMRHATTRALCRTCVSWETNDKACMHWNYTDGRGRGTTSTQKHCVSGSAESHRRDRAETVTTMPSSIHTRTRLEKQAVGSERSSGNHTATSVAMGVDARVDDVGQ